MDIVLCMKVNEEKWIRKLKGGQAYFNFVEKFIEKAEKEGNNEQGDKYEGVFARIKKNDVRLTELRERFKDDLEVISDSDHVMLRRKSSRNIRIFCMYGIRKNELKIDAESVREVDGEYYGVADYCCSSKMYSGFLNGNDVWGFYASTGHFCDAIERALDGENLQYRKTLIQYDIDLNKEFYIEPDDDYEELNHKRSDLKYQHEIRYKLLSRSNAISLINSSEEGYTLEYQALPDNSCGIVPGKLKMQFRCKIGLLEE